VLSNSGERILSDKVAGGKQRYRSFLPFAETTVTLNRPLWRLENAIGRVPLGEQGAFWIVVDNSSAYSSACEKMIKIDLGSRQLSESRCESSIASS